MNIYEFDGLRLSLYGLKVIKLAYDCGIDVSEFPEYGDFHVYSTEMEIGDTWSPFIRTLTELFEIVEWWSPYDEESYPDRVYWLHQAGKIPKETIGDGVIVILDDRIEREMVEDNGCYSSSTYELFYGFAEILPIEKGFLVHFDEDDGQIDMVEILLEVVDIYNKMINRGEKINEVDIGNFGRS